jgi:hypothetical protein
MSPISTLLLAARLGLSGCAHVQPAISAADATETWLFSETVIYRENHDPAMVWLADGRKLQVSFGEIPAEQIDTWQAGRPLRLAYSSQTGSVLIDPATSARLPVLAGLGEGHPLDLLLAQFLTAAASTQAIVEAYAASSELWDGERRRVLGLLLASPIVPTKTKQTLRQADSRWATYREAQVGAAATLYSRGGGTLWRIETACFDHGLRRSRALECGRLVAGAN